MAIDKPGLNRVWAGGAPEGDVVDPDVTTPGKFTDGWRAEIPPYQHFNFIQRLQTQGLAHINEQGIPVWDSETVYPVNGIAKGSDGNVYKALSEQAGNDPVTSSGFWRNWDAFNRVIDGQIDVDVAGGTDVTIGELDSKYSLINLTGALTANINFIVPDTPRKYTIVNSTSGSFSVNVKTVTGNGVAVSQGQASILRSDGADVVTVSSNSAPLSSVLWAPSRANIWPGYGLADGQELSRATYPDLWEMVNTGKVPVIAEATWLADPTQRGKYTTGDGSTTFRVPDYNGKSAGAIGGVYLTGDGLKTAAENGLIRDDQMQQITGAFGNVDGSKYFTNGAFSAGDFDTDAHTESSTSIGINFDSADSPDARTGTYTHGVDVSGCWVIRLFGAVVNVGSADAAQLATDYANLAGEVANKLDANDALGSSSYGWVNEKANRSSDVTYTNSTGVPIEVIVTARADSGAAATLTVTLNGSVIAAQRGDTVGTSFACITFLVPNGDTYSVSAQASLEHWWEVKPV